MAVLNWRVHPRRGTVAKVLAVTDSGDGELLISTDENALYIGQGDGISPVPVKTKQAYDADKLGNVPASGYARIEQVYKVPTWQSYAEYDLEHVVVKEGKLYRCVIAHTSSSSFSSDLVASFWELLSDVSVGATQTPNQSTKLGVVASAGSPYVFTVDIPQTSYFNRPPVEVLKFTAGTENQVTTVCSFDNADASSFQPDSNILFDGKMQLRTTFTTAMTDLGPMGTGNLYSFVIDKTQYKIIEKIEVI